MELLPQDRGSRRHRIHRHGHRTGRGAGLAARARRGRGQHMLCVAQNRGDVIPAPVGLAVIEPIWVEPS